MPKKSQPFNYSFESTRTTGGKFTKIHQDMNNSKAWQEISLRQRGLYLEFKNKFTKYKNGDTNENNISFPRSEYMQLYGNERTFRKDIDELISKGFIKVVTSGWTTRQPSIYGLSNLWQKYNVIGFEIPYNHKRAIRSKGTGK